MAGLFLVRGDDPAFAEAALAEARQGFARQGFAAPAALAVPGWTLLHFPYVQGGPAMRLVRGADFVCAAGTLCFDDRMGEPALAALLDALDPLRPDWSRLRGQFALVLRKGGRTFLLTDYFAAFQLFHDRDHRLFSTSMVAAARALPRVRLDPQGVYEYAFNVVPIGDDTVLADLKLLGPRRAVELLPHGILGHALAKPLPAASGARDPGERIEAASAALLGAVRAHLGPFGDRVQCPLSGGLDSRLLLAALRAAGSRPNLYVYGPAASPDVRIARAIGAAEGLAVAHIDKEALRSVDPDAFAAEVTRNFDQFDALPTYGNIFDNGGHRIAQNARHAEGALAASGGCGEIFRNFFFLPDRPITAAAVAGTFFARFDRRDATGLFDPSAFLAAIREKILAALEIPGYRGPLPRLLIEHIYPRVRCRALFGREISLEARRSPYLMPFLDAALVAEAMTLPIPLKNAGRFEARLIAAIDPALARHPSAYGHDFLGPPGRRHRFDEWATRIRPPWLRRASYGLRRRLQPIQDEHGGLLAPAFMGRVIDLEFPILRRYFHLNRIADSGLWRRLAALEYFAASLGGRLRE